MIMMTIHKKRKKEKKGFGNHRLRGSVAALHVEIPNVARVNRKKKIAMQERHIFKSCVEMIIIRNVNEAKIIHSTSIYLDTYLSIRDATPRDQITGIDIFIVHFLLRE